MCFGAQLSCSRAELFRVPCAYAVMQLPEIPRTMIQSSLYFSSKPLNRFGHLQLQLQAMAPFIEQCTQKMELFELLGTRQYLLYEPDVLSIR